MLSKELSNYLNTGHVAYITQQHPPAYSAQEVAEQAHISGRRVAKTVVVKLDGEMALCILPATERVNFSVLCQAAGTRTAELASKDDVTAFFPRCEPGVLPAFGNLYGLSVFLSESLKGNHPLAFGSGNSSEIIVLSWGDFNKLVQPVILTNDQRDAIG